MATLPSNPPANNLQQPTEIKEALNDFLVTYVFKDSNMDRETGPQSPPRFPVYHHHPIEDKMAKVDSENTDPNKSNQERIKTVTDEIREVLDGRKNRTGKSKTEILPKNTTTMKYRDEKIVQLPPGQ